MKSNLVRLSGLAAMLGGVLWALWAGVEQSVGWGEPGSAAYDLYELVNRLLPIALPLNLVVLNPPLNLVLSLALNPILSDKSRQHLVLVDFPVERYQLNRMALVLPSFR